MSCLEEVASFLSQEAFEERLVGETILEQSSASNDWEEK